MSESTYTTFTNRIGKLVVQSTVLTEEVMVLLRKFNTQNNGVTDQESLICGIGLVKEDVNDDPELFDLCAAIFINAKNYLIDNEGELINQMELCGVGVLKNIINCWVPADRADVEMYFIDNGSLN